MRDRRLSCDPIFARVGFLSIWRSSAYGRRHPPLKASWALRNLQETRHA